MSFPIILVPEAAQVWHLNQQIAQFETFPLEQQRLIQAQSLRALLTWVAEHSLFWHERLRSVGWASESDPWLILESLPILTRSDLQDHYDGLSCEKYFPPGSCVVAQSTGSTGRPVRTLKHKESYHLRYLSYALRGSVWHQLDVSKTILKYSARVTDGFSPNWGTPEAWFAKTGDLILCRSMGHNLSDMYEALKTNRPSYVVADGSIANALSHYALEQDPDERPQVKAILTTGSAITPRIREECNRAFGAKVINRYTNEEVGWMAIQCPKHDHLHVMSSNVIIEIVDEAGNTCPAGQRGRVLVTALHSEAMPIIRYDVGDIAEWGEPCDCGIRLPVIRRVWGREREFVRTPTGALRHIVLMAEDFLKIAPITDMRFRYYTNPLLRFEVVCQKQLTVEQRQLLSGVVQSLLGFECPVAFDERSAIDWGETDKRISFMVMHQPWIG